jgi:uncharacterized protein YndB with AHSA1/START domain
VITIERTVRTDRPVEQVFRYLSDFTTTTEWDPGTVRTVRMEGDGGVGTTYQNTSRFGGRETELTYRVRELVPNERIVLVGENSTVRATDTMTFRTVPSGTEVTYRAEFRLKGIAALATPLLKGRFAALGDEAERGLRDALDRLP